MEGIGIVGVWEVLFFAGGLMLFFEKYLLEDEELTVV
jgi:hypothetical protein